MTCKVSFFKTIRETLKHHIASIFTVCLIYFIWLITFFLSVQNYASDDYSSALNEQYLLERLNDMTLPGTGYVIAAVLTALLLAFDFFRYLHSKKQVDFYDSLPISRKEWFFIRITCACVIFLVPYLICIALEILILAVYGFLSTILLTNLLWNVLCMVLIFLAILFFGVLAMIMTGHPVIALFGFGVFSAYAPVLLRYIYPTYAAEYFKTFLNDHDKLHYLNYFSPIGLVYKLIHTNYKDWNPGVHKADFIFIVVMIVLAGILAYVLYQKRPSESAGRAMAFTKCNSVIRILIVVPLALYIGLYLSQVSSAGNTVWMIFGFVAGTILLHGIIESIFQFDIQGLWSHKKQMIGCILASLGIASIFWFDPFGYDSYMPELDELESIVIQNDMYDYKQETNDGISGEYLDETYQLIQNIIEQDISIDMTAHEDAMMKMTLSSSSQMMELSKKVDQKQWLYVEYRFKNGTTKSRQYFMSVAANIDLYDTIFATKEYKDDICPLYKADWKEINYIDWSDGIYDISLYMTEAEKEHLFETYIAEFTPFTYSESLTDPIIGHFTIRNEYDSKYNRESCPVYSSFTQTIALLEKYMLAHEHSKEYGSLTQSILDKYEIYSLEIYCEDAPLTISDYDKIESLKGHLIITDQFYKTGYYGEYDWSQYYDVNVAFATPDGFRYASALIPRNIVDTLN